MGIDGDGLGQRNIAKLHPCLGELGAEQVVGIAEDLVQRPTGMDRGRRPAEGEHTGDEVLELLNFLSNDL